MHIHDLEKRLPAHLHDLIRDLGRLAQEKGYNAYLVGGPVRDLIMGRTVVDLDITVEGDGPAFATAVASHLGTKYILYPRFMTATIIAGKKVKIDIATARKEIYPEPAVLPLVEQGGIKDDLFRRDFTINAMAMRINPRVLGELVDFFGGLRDIKERKIRILHDKSFIDDPTRIFRAVRFQKRFGFELEEKTKTLIQQAIAADILCALEKYRIINELRIIAKEELPLKCVAELVRLNALKCLHPGLATRADWLEFVERFEKMINDIPAMKALGKAKKWKITVLALTYPLDHLQIEELGKQLKLSSSSLTSIRTSRDLAEWMRDNSHNISGASASEIYSSLKEREIEEVAYAASACNGTELMSRIKEYIKALYCCTVETKGEDLMAVGIEPGPVYSEIFEQLKKAKLDGRIRTKEEELRFVIEKFRDRCRAD